MCNVWTQVCSCVQCASNEEKIKQREDKVFVAISEKFRLLWSVYISTVQFRAAIESARNEEDNSTTGI